MPKPVSPRLVFDHLRSGWLRGHVILGADRHDVLASWLHDTPRVLVEAATAVLDGHRASVTWVEEPGSTVWLLDPDRHVVRLTIVPSNLLAPPADWQPGEGKDYTTTPRDFGRAVLDAMTDLAIASPPDLYAEQSHWGMPYPTAAVRELRSRLREQAEGVRKTPRQV